MSATALFNETITPVEGDDTIIFPRRFYGRKMRIIEFVDAPAASEPEKPSVKTKPPALTRENFPHWPRFTKEQIDAWRRDDPDIKAFSGILKDAGLPPDITMKNIREMRLQEKYERYLAL